MQNNQPNNQPNKQKILIAGDIMMHDSQQAYLNSLRKELSDNVPLLANKLFDEKLVKLLQSSNVVLGNLETISNDNLAYQGFPKFNAPEIFLSILKEIGFTDLVVTNNHSKDHTYASWRKTVENLFTIGIKPHGHHSGYHDHFKNLKDLYVIAGSDRFNKEFDEVTDKDLMEHKGYMENYAFQPRDIKEFKQFFTRKSIPGPNYIVYCHAGEEYNEKLSDDQKEILEYITITNNTKNKATIFSHSHVIGTDYQRTNFTSKLENGMGNFCSMQENLDKQFGSIIEYEYNIIDEKLLFIKQHVVQTIKDGDEIRTFLIHV